MKPCWLLLLSLLMLLTVPAALADDVCVIEDASSVSAVATDRSYLRVCCPHPGDGPVTLTIRDAWGGLVYQRDYGVCRGAFRSEDVYLRLDGVTSAYQVTLTCGDSSYQVRVTREQPLLTDSGVYADGLPLSQLTGRRGNKSVVILDADVLSGSTLTVPLVSGDGQLGYVNFTVVDGELVVSADLTVEGRIEKSTVYVARDAVTAATLGSNHFSGTKTKLNRSVALRGTPYAAVLVQLTVVYDAGTVQVYLPDPRYLEMQEDLWELMVLTTANEAVG